MGQKKRNQKEITGKFVLVKKKPNAAGKYHVHLRYTIDRVEAIRGTGVWVKEKDWDEIKQIVKSSDVQSGVLNTRLKSIKTNVDNQILSFPANRHLTAYIVRDMLDGTYTSEDKKRRDFIEIVSKTLKTEYQQDKIAYSTYYNAIRYMETFKKFLSHKQGVDSIDVEDVTESLIDDYIIWRKQDRENCNETINKALTPIIKGLRSAVGLGVATESLLYRIKEKYMRKERKKLSDEDLEDEHIDYLTMEQMQQLYDIYDKVSFDRTRDYLDMFFFAFHACGLRFSDILTLRWCQVNLEKRVINKVLYKGRVPHFIQLTQPAVDILEKWKEKTGKSEFVFGLLHTGFDLNDDMLLDKYRQSKARSIRTSLTTVGEKIGLPFNLRMHVARHTFAVQALEKLRDVYMVSHLLAHQSIEVTTKVYAKFLPKTVETEVTSKLTFDFN